MTDTSATDTATPADTATPTEIVQRVRQCMLDIDMAGFGELFAEDGVLEMPYASGGHPHVLEGRENIRAYLIEGQSKTPLKLEEIDSDEVYQTSDPEVVVWAFDGIGSVSTTGNTYRTKYIELVRIRDGRIVLFRHYHEPVEWLVDVSRSA